MKQNDFAYKRAQSNPAGDALHVALPRAPKNTSPVPHLTSLYSFIERGPFGNSSYRGNCSGYLIRDLIRFFGAWQILDPMTGSGTCWDVCRSLAVDCTSFDLTGGNDACQAQSYAGVRHCDFVWLHPPYWRMIRYSDDAACLSNARSIDDFKAKLKRIVQNCLSSLVPNGKVAILMGDYFDLEERRYVPLVHFTREVCLELGLWPACTDIIRFQHGNTSSSKTYRRSFIPGLHDVCMVMERAPVAKNSAPLRS